MNLKQLEAFVSVAQSGSFSKAAKKLYLTQPTVSAHIASLEKELNVRLFVRNTKEVEMSEAGKTLFVYAKQMLEIEHRIYESFCAEREKENQCIKIAASTIPAQYLLPKILARFMERYPDEQVSVTEADSQKVVEQVIDQTVDIGFNGTVMEKKHCKYIPFYEDELVVITPNNAYYQKLQDEKKDITWIVGEPMIMREEGSGTRKEAQSQLRRIGIEEDQLNIIANIENQEIIKKSVSGGMGISIMSRLATVEEVATGKVLSFSLPLEGNTRTINVLYNKNFQLSASAERFLKVVKEVYG